MSGVDPDDHSFWTALHERIVRGDEIARNEVCVLLIPLFESRLRRAVDGADAHDVMMGVEDALMKYLDTPTRYHPDEGLLTHWLEKNACNRIKDIRRQARRIPEVPGGLDLSGFVSRNIAELMSIHGETPEAARERILGWTKDRRERRFVDARLDEAPIETQAKILGVANLPPDQQRSRVYRATANFIRRVKRHLGLE